MKEETIPTMNDVIDKHYQSDDNGYANYRAAMTEWEQITSAPLLKRIEELEELHNEAGKQALQVLEIATQRQQRISELEKERDELKAWFNATNPYKE